MTPRIILVPAALNLAEEFARAQMMAHRAQLPDWTALTVLVPHRVALRPLRARLAQHAGAALLGPRILTLSAFASEQPATDGVLTPLQARLRLAETLQAYLHLFPGQDAVTLAAELLALFSELSQQAPELGQDAARFAQRIERGYGARHARFSQEAQIVHSLWRAWLADSAGRDPAAAYISGLSASFAACAEDSVALIGFDLFTPAELPVIRMALARGAQLWLHGREEGRDGAALAALLAALGVEPERVSAAASPRVQTLNTLFSGSAALRAIRAAPPLPGLRVQPCVEAEHEARVAELAIREWLLAGRRDIAVISNDRRYARRLRALLERAGVPLNDHAGWALSTSRAAASLMHWLEALDSEFSFRPLLDLIKSPFYASAEDLPLIDALEAAVYQQKITGGLQAIGEAHPPARTLLRPAVEAARAVTLAAGAHPARDWCAALLRSLRALPLCSRWAEDIAGRELLRVLTELEQGLAGNGLRLDWQAFRQLLQNLLEAASFSPQAPRGPVRLLTLEQSLLLDCDALLISGAAAGRFPAPAPATAFFNQAVRAELGLPTHAQRQNLNLARFIRLLQGASEVLITYAAEDDSSEPQAAAWVAWLQAAGASGAQDLAARAGRAGVEVAAPAPPLQPAPAPRVVLSAAQLPVRIHASEHQSLINCPYQFYARKVLGLAQKDEPDEPVSRSDYGERVHKILRAFHQQVEALPAPFGAPVAAHNRADAADRLQALARAVFAPDLAARVLAQAWLLEFESLIPQVLDWMQERALLWPQVQPEQRVEQTLSAQLTAHGRVDRLEGTPDGEHGVVDYKTGSSLPAAKDLDSGEEVQVLHYAALIESCTAVEYLHVHPDARKPLRRAGEDLQTLRESVRTRLLDVFAQMGAGVPLPANGSEDACRWCEAAGICRKGSWSDG